MDDSALNSLTQRLIQNGILSDNSNSTDSIDSNFNFFEENKKTEHFEINKEETASSPIKLRKRLNIFESVRKNEGKNHAKTNNKEKLNLSKKEIFFIKFFPKLYKAHLAKDALKKLKELNIDTEELLNKTIPYGEEEMRYRDLIKYLEYANEIQIKINNKFE